MLEHPDLLGALAPMFHADSEVAGSVYRSPCRIGESCPVPFHAGDVPSGPLPEGDHVTTTRRATRNRWLTALEADDLASSTVHVWRARLDFGHPVASHLTGLLSRQERERAARFAVSEDRHRFLMTRALLRTLLARYTGCEATRLVLANGPRGKPELPSQQNPREVRFNVSHAGELALLAFGVGRDIGVDVERIRGDVPVERLAARFFSGNERETLERLPAERRRERFFAYWTRREAVAKASGEGLSLASDRLDLSPGFEAEPSDTWIQVRRGSRFRVRDLDVAPGYRAAVAVEGGGWNLRCAEWISPSAPQACATDAHRGAH